MVANVFFFDISIVDLYFYLFVFSYVEAGFKLKKSIITFMDLKLSKATTKLFSLGCLSGREISS